MNFKIRVYDKEEEIFSGAAKQFLKDNENEESVLEALEQCKKEKVSYLGGGAAPIIKIIRCNSGG